MAWVRQNEELCDPAWLQLSWHSGLLEHCVQIKLTKFVSPGDTSACICRRLPTWYEYDEIWGRKEKTKEVKWAEHGWTSAPDLFDQIWLVLVVRSPQLSKSAERYIFKTGSCKIPHARSVQMTRFGFEMAFVLSTHAAAKLSGPLSAILLPFFYWNTLSSNFKINLPTRIRTISQKFVLRRFAVLGVSLGSIPKQPCSPCFVAPYSESIRPH